MQSLKVEAAVVTATLEKLSTGTDYCDRTVRPLYRLRDLVESIATEDAGRVVITNAISLKRLVGSAGDHLANIERLIFIE